MNESLKPTKISDFLVPISRSTSVDQLTEYSLLGIRLDGKGAFLREKKLGSQISATTLFQVRAGDFIYSRLFAWRGAFDIVDEDLDSCFVSSEFPTFVPINSKIDIKFLRYWLGLPSILSQIEANCTGSTPLTRNRFKEKFFLALEIPLPSLEEQKRIVARIEELADRIEEARGLRREAVEEAEEIEKAAIGSKLAKIKNVNSIPLRELVMLKGGGTPSKSNPSFWQGKIPWISPKDMKIREISDAVDHITEEAVKETSAKLISPKAVLIVVRGMILAHTVPSAILQVPAAINQDMKALIPTGRISSKYLCKILWGLNDKLLELVEKSTHDTRKLETSKLLNFRIPVPSFNEQNYFVTYLDDLKAKVDALNQLQSETSAELDALLPSILDKAFKGEL